MQCISSSRRRVVLAAYGIAFLSSPSIAETPYEHAAKVDMEQLASSILAASVCKGVQFHGDAVIASVAAAMVLIGRTDAEDTFFSAIRANIDDMSANGREAWCSATIKAAKQRKSDLLTEDNDAVEENKRLQ
ncbi:MAG: hypothetical protein J2P49_11125 [Methylocapsa sp.]|nr:hypothetical protein [Methylocapsa sp.]